jgi:WD40 repeat protein
VDVYLYSSENSSPQFVKNGVPYGTILPYHAVNAGNYIAKVRAAGASASSNPVWSVSFTVHAGGSYTVAPLRATAQQGQLKVIDNDLTAPTGKSLVRVIQADLNQGQVTFHCSCAAGAPGNITTDAAPGTVSRQKAIPAGTWTMTATGPSAKTSLPVALTDGTVHNEIVISKPGGGIDIINLVQAPPSYQHVPVDLPFSGPGVPIASVAFSPSGAKLAIAAEQICLWDIAAKDCTSTFGNAKAYSLAFSPDGKTLAVTEGINSASTYLWNVATGRPAAPLTDPDSTGAYSVAFTHNGKLLAVGDGNGHTYLWDVATRKLSFKLSDPGSQGVNSVAFSPDDKLLAVGDGNGHTYLWDVATRKLNFKLSDPGTKGVMSVAFSPDGKLLVAGDNNGHTYLWDVATGKLRFPPLPDPGTRGVASVACSPDNTTMAAAGNNGSIYIWNVRNGKLLATLADPNKAVINSVAFSPDGQVLAASDSKGSVFLWYKS